MSRTRLTKEEILIRFKNKHGEKYNYSKLNFTGVKNKIIITCKKHGDFEQIVNSHLSGCGCSKCSFESIHKGKILTTEDFIKKVKTIHGEKYDYSLVDYVNNITIVKIICPIHGEFEQKPHNHKRGSGCPKCGNIKTGEAAINTSRGWSLTEWENKINKTPNAKPMLYVIKCYNEEESFIKIGITMRPIEKRFCNKTLMPYNFNILLEVTAEANTVFNSEIKIKKEFKMNKYKPLIKFSGWGECFNISCENKLINLINEE